MTFLRIAARFSETAVALQPDTAGDPSTSRMADVRAVGVL